MLHLWATLAVAATSLRDRFRAMPHDEREAGYTTETVVWTVALLVIAGVVVTAITAFVEGEVPKIVSPND